LGGALGPNAQRSLRTSTQTLVGEAQWKAHYRALGVGNNESRVRDTGYEEAERTQTALCGSVGVGWGLVRASDELSRCLETRPREEWRLSGMLRRMALVRTDVSEELSSSTSNLTRNRVSTRMAARYAY
jgi:hypothetical protein